jgi:excisionase family DNA binding protein
MNEQNQKAYFSVHEAAAYSGLGIMEVYRRVHAGEIPHIKAGRKIILPKAAFVRWFETAGGTYAAA